MLCTRQPTHIGSNIRLDNLPEEILKDGRRARMLAERELLSLDLSAHPLDFYPFDNGVTKMKDLPSIATGKTIKIMGL